jgi:VIT1/CCC1 family predicted Fe2+/Mn2+ transporter
MSDQLITAMVSVVLAIIGLAALATVLSPKASTAKVINSASQGLSTDIGAAVAPVTGGSLSVPISPSLGGQGF